MNEPVRTPGASVDVYRRSSSSTVQLVIGNFYRRGSGGRIFELVEVYKRNPSKNFATTAKIRYVDRKDGALAQIYAAEINPHPLSPLQILSAQA